MDEKYGLAKYFANVGAEYLWGGYTKLHKSWKQEKISFGFDKFYFIVDGGFYLKINDREYVTKKNQLFLLPYNSKQTYYHISEDYCTKYWFHFSLPCQDKDLLECINLPHFIQVGDADVDKVTALFKKILYYENHSGLIATLKQKSCIMELLSYYIEKTGIQDKFLILENVHIEILTDYIENHLSDELTIKQLADVLHFHPNYFIRYFKKNMGISPIDYVNNLRVDHARKMLQYSNQTVQSIAFHLGFSSPYYFTRVFKNRTGYTPTEYRKLRSHNDPV